MHSDAEAALETTIPACCHVRFESVSAWDSHHDQHVLSYDVSGIPGYRCRNIASVIRIGDGQLSRT